MNKLALVMIVKASDDEGDLLRNCLANISQYVDGIFININHKKGIKPSEHTEGVARSFATKVIKTEWHDNFAEARNRILAEVPDEYTHVLWLDTDDTVEHPEKIKQLIEKTEADAIYADYLYETDESGNPLTIHAVARVFKNNGAQEWKGRIHETIVEKRGIPRVGTKDFRVIHHSNPERRLQSTKRNIRLLEIDLKEQGNKLDPRTIYYLGCSYIDIGEVEKAKGYLNTYLEMSGWDQERAAAHVKLGRVYLNEGDRFAAKRHFVMAIGEDPMSADPRVELGSLELEIKQYHKARKWLESVLEIKENLTTLERNPMNYTFRTYLLLADVYLGLGGSYLDKALEYAKKALKFKRKDKKIREYVKTIEAVVEDKKILESLVLVAQRLKKNKEDDKIKTLAYSVPKQLDDNPLILKMRDEQFEWPEKSIAIACGDSPDDEWGPWSLEQGIGGSEEAVIRLSRQLVALGYKVVVYGKPMDAAGFYDGVMYRNFWELSLKDKFDIFVGWRMPGLFDNEIHARKKYLWLHDVVKKGEFTPERLANLDKVIVLSKYHRSLFPNIPDDKIMMSANGIDPEEFEPGDTVRDPHKIFYGSSHVRGLAYLYDIWPEVKKAVPDATLDVYYGRGTYDAVNQGNPERLKWMDDMQLRAKELEGVTDHGKISQHQIVQEMFRSGLWAYPCPFPEIYCITAIKAQAAGAIPVASDYAALDETIQFGHKQTFREFDSSDLQTYKESLIWWLKHPEEQEKIRPEMMEWATQHSWARVAEAWAYEFEKTDN